MRITSKDNENIKHIRKLKDKKYRDEFNEYIVEGIKLIREAIIENANIKTIVVCDDATDSQEISQELLYDIAKYNCLYVDEKVFTSITDVKQPQGILAVVEKKNTLPIDYSEDIIIALDDVQDPGNIGTILRSIDSSGIKQVILSKRSGDVYNPKVVRSTMGAIFRVNIVETDDLIKTLKEIKKHKFQIVASSLRAKEMIYDIDYKKKVIIVGNESNGVSLETLNLSDIQVKIPMLGKTESLNVAVATSIILYEYVRQKKLP